MVADRGAISTVPERQFRGPGCGPACVVVAALVPGRFGRSELLLHDPEAHENYGRRRAPGGSCGLVEIGPLALDLDRRAALVGGVDVGVTPREWQVLEVLARSAPRACSREEITLAIWDEWTDPNTPRTFVNRIRARLGPAAWVLQTRPGFGYVLTDRPPAPAVGAVPVPGGRWSRLYPRCICCGRVDRPYYAHGRCERCRQRPLDGWCHYGPCGAPPPATTEDA